MWCVFGPILDCRPAIVGGGGGGGGGGGHDMRHMGPT